MLCIWGALAVGAAVAASATSRLRPPVIHESFTLLSCPAHPVSTLDLEGCAEHRILREDRRVDVEVAAIFPLLYDNAARRRLIAAQTVWLRFRAADCSSESDQYEGGTLAGVVAANCFADVDAARVTELRAFKARLSKS